MPKKKDIPKDKLISAEIRRFNAALEDLDENKKAVVAPLIKTAAFLSVTIQEIEAIINEEGVIVTYQNGKNQYGTKQSDAVKALVAFQKNLTAIVKTLADIAPAGKIKTSRLKALMGDDNE
jgi:hypothetical protein